MQLIIQSAPLDIIINPPLDDYLDSISYNASFYYHLRPNLTANYFDSLNYINNTHTYYDNNIWNL